MRSQRIETNINEVVRNDLDMYTKLVLDYLNERSDEDVQVLYQARTLAEKRLRLLLDEERCQALDQLLELYQKRIKLCVRYGWEQGYRLCLKVFRGECVGYPQEEETVNSYLQLYKLEALPVFRKLKEEEAALYRRECELFATEKFYDDIDEYYVGLEFDACQAAHYLGYIAGTKILAQIESGYVEDSELTVSYDMKMRGRLFYRVPKQLEAVEEELKKCPQDEEQLAESEAC